MVEVIEKVIMMEIAYRVEMFLCAFFRMVIEIFGQVMELVVIQAIVADHVVDMGRGGN